MKRNLVEKTEKFDVLFYKVWNNMITTGYVLYERSLPTEHQILESWRIVQHNLQVEQPNSK